MAAKKFTSDLCFGKTVKVNFEKYDQYGRVIGSVHIDKINLNEELVKNGYAWHYSYFSNTIKYVK